MLMSRGEDSEEGSIRFWQVSPGSRRRGFWPEFKSQNIIAMGWDALGDLNRYSTEEEIEKALRKHYPASYPADRYPANDINSIMIFSQEIEEGDVIVAKKGASREIYGIGKVLRGYHLVEARQNFKNVIDVEWIIGFDNRVEVETSKEFVQWTAHSIDQVRFDEIKQSLLRKYPQFEESFNLLMESPRRVPARAEGKYAILMSANIERNPGVFEYHQEHIRREGATYWGVGFPIDPKRITLPTNGFFYATDTRKVTHVAKIEEIEAYDSPRRPKEPRLRPPEYKDGIHRTYFKFSRLEKLPASMEIHDFTQWNGKGVVRPPQNYVLVRDPTGLVQPLDLQSPSIKTELIVNETVLEQVCAILNSGSHLIITGPVGTGKTSLSEDLCRAAKENRFCDGYVLTTASSDWTTFDTIGGYMPTEKGELRFEQGTFLEAIRMNKWLIIDEINRADIDKAFGQLFTVLSGQRVELPFKHSNGNTISIEPTTENRSYFDNSEGAYKVGKNWRIIATMNVYDMNFLFEMSYAFMRRFAFVYLDVPEKFEELIGKWCGEKKISDETKEKLNGLTKLTERKMGPAIIKDMVEYIEHRGDGERELAEAIVAYIVPQLEGLEREKIKKIWDQIGKIFDEKAIPNGIIRPILKQIVGIEFEEISE